MPNACSRSIALAAAATAAIFAGCETTSTGASGVMTQADQQALTPDQAVAMLKAGNERFVQNRLTGRDWLAQARATSDGQYPLAIVLGCVDSRVPAEVIFDSDIGDIFVGRVAGNFENTDLLGSMEFATAVAGSKAIVVLGHTACGAVKGTIDQARLGNLTPLLSNIEPSVNAALRPGEARTSDNTDLVNRVTEENVRRTVRDIQDRSPVIADLVEQGQLVVVGAIYDLETGRVTWLDT